MEIRDGSNFDHVSTYSYVTNIREYEIRKKKMKDGHGPGYSMQACVSWTYAAQLQNNFSSYSINYFAKCIYISF